jgi:hypothetical protein
MIKTPPDRGSVEQDPHFDRGVQKMTPPGVYIYILYIEPFLGCFTIIPDLEQNWDLFFAELKQLRVHVLPRLSSDRCTAHSEQN